METGSSDTSHIDERRVIIEPLTTPQIGVKKAPMVLLATQVPIWPPLHSVIRSHVQRAL